ncbi:AsnC family transcriptional regulator [Pilimelia terevasa]|uniref:AsnC family transcriptional regulator n=1 Tax=Pilimelia terevasa TaxID=53372 RepID=A0A8J3BHA7_9ACTN|nr:Lrp/AsnC family transcriptional regulator [Pilimelia terevasa]GGK21567.1 AsnC family transcriptional regulator [Pilimelia terevasa]
MDAIDRTLIELLRDNARLSYAELARQVGLSPPSVHDRLGKLESTGVIKAYRADVDPEAIGLGVTAMIMIVQEPGHEIEDMTIRFRQQPEIESCYFMAGHESFLLIARLGTIAELEQLIGRINRVPGVASTRTTIALSTKWEQRPQPHRKPPAAATPG